jgi:hypothetical protein
MEEDLEVACMG